MSWIFSAIYGILFGGLIYVSMVFFGPEYLKEPISLIFIVICSIILIQLVNYIEHAWRNKLN